MYGEAEDGCSSTKVIKMDFTLWRDKGVKMSYYIIIRCPLGCGKSTIAERLAKKLNGKHIAYDRILDDNNLTITTTITKIKSKRFAIPILQRTFPVFRLN